MISKAKEKLDKANNTLVGKFVFHTASLLAALTLVVPIFGLTLDKSGGYDFIHLSSKSRVDDLESRVAVTDTLNRKLIVEINSMLTKVNSKIDTLVGSDRFTKLLVGCSIGNYTNEEREVYSTMFWRGELNVDKFLNESFYRSVGKKRGG